MTVRLLDITATAHRDGNQIELSWAYPSNVVNPGVRVVRGTDGHPATVDDGFTVAQGTGLTTATDIGLIGERVYYYTLFAFQGNPAQDDPDPHNVASAMAITRYDFAGQLYAMLPAIYHRYDAERLPRPGTGLPEDADKGLLRRFLDLPGGELDRLYSHARAALALIDPDRVDGRLLPLLAQWIGWPTDHRLPVQAQRNEIRFAPRIYQTVGGIPALDATVARVTRWANKTKEFVHNVARSNQPELLNLWSALRPPSGAFAASALASVNFAHDGRPAAVREDDGSVLLFFHTHRLHGWDIWAKRFVAGEWGPSFPVVDRPGVDKNPTAALQGNRLWLFWHAYDPDAPAGQRWRVWLTTRTGTGDFAPPQVFGDPADIERRMPAAVADNTGGVWLFWLEWMNGIWQLRYNRHNGTTWQLSVPGTFPLDAVQLPRVQDDLFVLFHPGSANQRLWVFWARQDTNDSGVTRWSIVYRIKQGLDPTVSDWSAIRPLPKQDTGAYHDREPAALLASGGNLEVFFGSTRPGGWTVCRNVLATGPLTWSGSERVDTGPHTQRAPLAIDAGTAGTLLTFRSNKSIAYDSDAFGATHTLDHRYAGTTTVDTGASAKLDLVQHRRFEDFQTYTYDTGEDGKRDNNDRVARDTVGLYLTPTIADPAQIEAAITRLAGVLAEFTPVTTRAVFITP